LGQNGGLGREAWLTSDNVYIQNGHLVLRSQKQTINNFNYTSGAVTSQNKKYWKNARVCVRALLPGGPAAEDQGIWPAHWLLPNDNSCWPDHGEIDILEMINGDGDVHGTYHWNSDYPKTSCNYHDTGFGKDTKLADWSSNYHEYSAEWSDTYVAFLLDSKVYNNVTHSSNNPPPEFPVSPMYVLLNTAVGGPWPGPPNANTHFPTYHYIDYVEVAVRT